MSLSLIIPAYNEEERIVPFLLSIAAYCKQHPEDISEVIVVDDGSKDATARVAKESGGNLPNMRVISLPQNRGKGAAVQEGVLAASGDMIVFMDADGATGIEELPSMIVALKNSDVAIGNRWMEGAKTERHSLLRAISGFVYRNYMKLFGLGDVDTMCGFKGYSASAAKDLYASLREMRWLFDTEIAYRAIQRGYRINNFPIAWESKDGSKLSTSTLFASALNIFPLIVSIRKEEQKKRAMAK